MWTIYNDGEGVDVAYLKRTIKIRSIYQIDLWKSNDVKNYNKQEENCGWEKWVWRETCELHAQWFKIKPWIRRNLSVFSRVFK